MIEEQIRRIKQTRGVYADTIKKIKSIEYTITCAYIDDIRSLIIMLTDDIYIPWLAFVHD